MTILCYDCEACPAVTTEDGVPLCYECWQRFNESRKVYENEPKHTY
jgi:hypothetical protein